jgi:hypothetical protein
VSFGLLFISAIIFRKFIAFIICARRDWERTSLSAHISCAIVGFRLEFATESIILVGNYSSAILLDT